MKGITIGGIGVATNAIASVGDLGAACQTVDAEVLSRFESPASWAVAAVHQAWHMSGLRQLRPERIGLLYSSIWGSVSSTLNYLESLQEAGGRYASPRHFTRSTYASPASVLGIHFHIHGPCEALSFDRFPITGMMDRARRLLATDRCDAVVLCWADDSVPLVADLARRAVDQLRRRVYARYAQGPLGAGAVALVAGQTTENVQWRCDWTDEQHEAADARPRPPFPTDGAVSLAAALVHAMTAKTHSIWTERASPRFSQSLTLSWMGRTSSAGNANI